MKSIFISVSRTKNDNQDFSALPALSSMVKALSPKGNSTIGRASFRNQRRGNGHRQTFVSYSIFILFFLISSFQSFGQDSWINLPQEDQAEKALDEGHYALAIQLYEKALEIRKAKYPQGFHCSFIALKEVSDAMDNLIVAHSKAGNFTKHLELSEELSSWSEEGIELFPNKTSPYLDYGLTQIKIAESYQVLDQYDKGISVCQKVIDYFLNPGDNKPLKFVANYVIPYAYSRAGKILKHQGNLQASVMQHEKSVATWQDILQHVCDGEARLAAIGD